MCGSHTDRLVVEGARGAALVPSGLGGQCIEDRGGQADALRQPLLWWGCLDTKLMFLCLWQYHVGGSSTCSA